MIERVYLISLIEEEFETISLEDGIGIYEAEAIDNCLSKGEQSKARKKDIRNDWKLISDEVIDEHFSTLSFMDENGLRFTIPAFMRFSVVNFDMYASPSIDSLIHNLNKEIVWSFFSDKQRNVIANFLEFMVLSASDHMDVSEASLAYETIWSGKQKVHSSTSN